MLKLCRGPRARSKGRWCMRGPLRDAVSSVAPSEGMQDGAQDGVQFTVFTLVHSCYGLGAPVNRAPLIPHDILYVRRGSLPPFLPLSSW